eukprot:symbB.v1.2.007829.t1/scaffold463.1/size291460/10
MDPQQPPSLRGTAKPPPPEELREALAKANGSKEKVSDMEVQRLQKALEKSHQKLQHYEESKEADYFPQEPDTARTHVAQEEEHRIPTASPGVGLRPSRSEYAQGVQGTVVKVVPRTPVSIVSRVSAVSPSPVRLGSPARARKTLDISTPPARPVQWSPHPYRGRLTDAPRVESRLQEAPPSAMTMAVTAMAQTAAMATRPPVQSPPRPARQWPRGSSVAKPATGQVIKSGAVSVSVAAGRSPPTPAPGKRVTTTWTTPRVAPPPLSSVGTVQMPPAQAPRAGSLSAPPVLLLPDCSNSYGKWDDSHSVYHSTFTPFCAMEARIPFQQPPEPTDGNLTWQQLEGERLSQDPDWPPGTCWAWSYVRMHNTLLERAKEIQTEGQQAQEEQDGRSGLEAPSIASSLRLLKTEVFSLCPMHFLISGILISFILTTLSFMIPWIQGQLVDVAVDAAAKYKNEGPQAVDIGGELFEPIFVLSVLMFSSYFCEILVGILFAICGHTTVTRLRIKLFQNLTEQEIAFYDSHVSGELSSRLINDSQALSSLTQFTTQTVLGAIVKFAGSLVAMFATHPRLAVLATVITPINMLLVKRTGKTVGYYGVVQNHAMAKANAVAVEVLGSIRTVQSNVGEKQEATYFMYRLNRYLRIIKATVYLETVLRFTQYGLSKARNIIVLAVAMHQVITGDLTIGSYTAFAQYDGFKNLADIWINFKQTITSTGKFIQLLLRQPDGVTFESGLEPMTCAGQLILQDVSFSYAGRPEHQVLSALNLEANPGDVVALVGESGAGKSTLGRLLLRHYDPTVGAILFDRVDYRRLNLRWLRAQIGFVEQEPVLFDRPLTQNISYGSASGSCRKAIEDAASRANAHHFISGLPKGYETHPGERAARISGGQKQRVAIARAIIRNPKLLVLDEATSALDSENEHIVQQALDELMTGRTTFVIAHRLSTVINATKILVLDKGRVIEQGSHSELVAKETSRYASFMKHQLVSPLLS